MKQIITDSKIPFIVKGIMCKEDAVSCIEAGAAGIIIGNHGGRVSESHASGISALREIVPEVKGKIKIIYDGGIRTGEDIFKAIAIGADYVMIGRPFVTAVLGAGRDGVRVLIERLKSQLERTMLLTGAKNINSISDKMINM